MSGIYRVNKNKNYSVISNTPLNDTRLTWEARGVMAYLLSKPDGWECRNYDLVNQGCASEHIISRIIGELQKFGYIYRKRVSAGRNKISWVTEVYESPEANPHFSIPQIFSIEKIEVEKVPNKVNTESSVNTDKNKLGPIAQKLLLICLIKFEGMTKKQKQQLAEVIDILTKRGITEKQLGEYDKFWMQSWRKGSPPTLLQVAELWGEFEQWQSTHNGKVTLTAIDQSYKDDPYYKQHGKIKVT